MDHTRSLKDVLIGLAVFFIIAVVVIWLAYIGLFIPPQIINWLNNSSEPQQAVIAFGTLTSAVLLILVRGGIAIPLFHNYIPNTDQTRRYVAGLPLWVMGGLVALSLVWMLRVFPSCQPPTSVIFQIAERAELRPMETLTVQPSETVNIIAKSLEEGVRLHCQWQYAGNAFQMLGIHEGCDIKVQFASKPGEGMLTLQASHNFCSQSYVFSLPVKVDQP